MGRRTSSRSIYSSARTGCRASWPSRCVRQWPRIAR
jgi:hypothetical protein